MGITIRYLVPADAGTSFIYSVERQEDATLFDFAAGVFRKSRVIPADDVSSKLTRRSDMMVIEFNAVEPGKTYIFRIRAGGRPGRPGRLIAEVPMVATGVGGQHVDPSYRRGKKFVDGKTIDARHHYTFYGADGSTIHTAVLWEDGTSSCNCPVWGPKVDGRRRCPHSAKALTLTADLDETGEQRPKQAAAPEAPATTPAARPFKRGPRSVDT